MEDYISRQEAINEIESHIRTAGEPYQLTETDEILNYAFEVSASCIYNLPAADVVEVVRCKDCRYYEPDNSLEGWCNAWSGVTVEDAFCSFAERMKAE